MRIVSLQVNSIQQTFLGDNHKLFTFAPGVNLVFSKKNSVGKTTLLRMLMYALGYSIPNTRGIRFSDYEMILTLVGANESEFILTRNHDYIELVHDGTEKDILSPLSRTKCTH